MIKTRKFASEKQIIRIKSAQNRPQIMLQCGPIRSALEEAHEVALELGLPEIRGFYGINLDTGEILSPND